MYNSLKLLKSQHDVPWSTDQDIGHIIKENVPIITESHWTNSLVYLSLKMNFDLGLRFGNFLLVILKW